jgi:hypothetical protein
LIIHSSDMIKRAETEVLHLNEALATMYSHLSSNNEPSKDELLSALHETHPKSFPSRLNTSQLDLIDYGPCTPPFMMLGG